MKLRLPSPDGLLRGAGVSLLLRLADMGFAYLASVVFARYLGVDGFGFYSFAVSVVMILTLPASFGLPPLIIRECGEALADGEAGRIRAIKRWAYRRVLWVSVPTILLAAAIFMGSEIVATDERGLFAAGLVLTFLLPLAQVRSAILRGINRIAAGQLSLQIVRPMLMLPVFVLLVLLGAQALAPLTTLAMVANVAGTLAAWGFGSWMLMRHMASPSAPGADAPFEIPAWRSSVLAMGLANGMNILDAQLGILLLGIMSANAEAGLYKVASQFAMLVSLGYVAANTALAPRIARSWREGRFDVVSRLVTQGARISVGIAVPLVLAFVLAGACILTIAFGEEFAAGALPLTILALGQLVNCLVGSATALLNMTHHERHNSYAFAIGIALNVVLGLALIPSYGAVGAAIAAAVSVVVRNVGLWIFAIRLTGIDTSLIGLRRRQRAD